jgi:hypothetical protein
MVEMRYVLETRGQERKEAAVHNADSVILCEPTCLALATSMRPGLGKSQNTGISLSAGLH